MICFPACLEKNITNTQGETTYPTLGKGYAGICQFPGGYMLNGNIYHSETTPFFFRKASLYMKELHLWFGNFPSSDLRLTIEISTYI